MKIQNLLKRAWIYYIIIGILFLIFSIKIIMSDNINEDILLKALGVLFLMMGFGNIIYSLEGIKNKDFHWGEILFWGVLESITGFLIVKEKLVVEKFILLEISSAVEKISSLELELEGYIIIFYIGTFLIFRGLSNIVTNIYNVSLNSKEVLVKCLINLIGIDDFCLGIVIIICMYINLDFFKYIILLYIFITSIFIILFGISLKKVLINKGIA